MHHAHRCTFTLAYAQRKENYIDVVVQLKLITGHLSGCKDVFIYLYIHVRACICVGLCCIHIIYLVLCFNALLIDGPASKSLKEFSKAVVLLHFTRTHQGCICVYSDRAWHVYISNFHDS